MNNLYLIGMPGCGKSTIGAEVGKCLHRLFLDLDQYIEQQEHAAIPEMFEKGEAYFRDMESKYLRQAASNTGVVVATGGGIVLRQGNVDIMRQSGKIILIDTKPERLVANSPLSGRPLIGSDKSRVFMLYEQRKAAYHAAADIMVDNNGSLEEAVERVLHICGSLF